MNLVKFDIDDSTTKHKDEVLEKPLGQMFLVYGQALVVRSSTCVVFFKLVRDKFSTKKENVRYWQEYHKINEKAFVYFIKGNIRI